MAFKKKVLFSSHDCNNFNNYSNGKCSIDRSFSSANISFQRNDLDFKNAFGCFVPGQCIGAMLVWEDILFEEIL